MAHGIPTTEFILTQYEHLRNMYASRNNEYSALRRIYDGEFASAQEAKASAVGSLGHDKIKLIYNVANATVRRYMDSMSAPPKIECIPQGFELEDLEAADKKTKFLEYIWDANQMPLKLVQAAYYQSLLDNAIFHVRPDPSKECKIRIELAVPDFFYPISKGDDWHDWHAVIYAFRKYEPEDVVIRDPLSNEKASEIMFHEVVVYWDRDWFVRIEDGQEVARIRHGLGCFTWFQAHNLPIPHRYRGQGDVDQAVGLNEYLNMMMSAMGDMIDYAANPIAIVRGTKVGGTNLPFAPRAVWELERDAEVGFLQWSGAPPSVEAQILRTIQAIEDTTGVSSPAFGREIPSGTSDKAVRSLLAGFNTRLGTKQQMLGDSLIKMNEAILKIAETVFPDFEVPIIGEVITPGKDMGRKRSYTVSPSEFKGWYKNRVVFSPFDATTQYFQEMDKLAKGVQSRYTTMKNLGTQNIWDELERIRIESEESANRENTMALARQGQLPPPTGTPESGFEQAFGIPFEQAIPPEQQRQMRRDVGEAALEQTATGEVGGAPGAENLAALPETPGARPGPSADEVITALRNVKGYSGPVTFKSGQFGGEVGLGSGADEATIRGSLGPLADSLQFTRLFPNAPLPEDASVIFDPEQRKKKLP